MIKKVSSIDSSITSLAPQEIFNRLDADRNGTIERTEFEGYIKNRGIIDPKRIDRLFRIVDADGSGDISNGEFIGSLQKSSSLPTLGTSNKPRPGSAASDASPYELKYMFDMIKTSKTDRLTVKDKSQYQPIMSYVNQKNSPTTAELTNMKGIFLNSLK